MAPTRTVCPPPHVSLIRALRRDYAPDKLDPSTLPFLRAFGVGYAATILPTLLKFIIGSLTIKSTSGRIDRVKNLFWGTFRILLSGFKPSAAPAAYGLITGGSKWGERYTVPWMRKLLQKRRLRRSEHTPNGAKLPCDDILLSDEDERTARITGTFLSSVISSLLAISILQSGAEQRAPRPTPVDAISPYGHLAAGVPVEELGSIADDALTGSVAIEPEVKPSRRESPTLELTLFALVRGLDTAARAFYFNLAPHRREGLLGFVARYADVILFQLSCYRIMWSWFYHPSGLPKSYRRWISQVARTDDKVLDLYRTGWTGEWRYRNTTSQFAIDCGRAVAKAAGLPEEAGDPNLIDWMPCYAVHGPEVASASCEVNAIKRWWFMWRTAMVIYTPVHLFPRLIFGIAKIRRSPYKSAVSVLSGASRSSSFLATFLALIWYSICLTRTRIGPNLLPFVHQNTWDKGVATFFGCFACGFSVLIENKRRRGEMALYVAPRAVYAVLDQSLPKWLMKGRKGELLAKYSERLAFALSAATIVTATIHRPHYVRGVVNGLMTYIMNGKASRRKGSRPPSEFIEPEQGKLLENGHARSNV